MSEAPVVTKNVRFDRDKKVVILKVTKEGDIKGKIKGEEADIGHSKEIYEQEFSIEGARQLYSDVHSNKVRLETDIKTIEKELEVTHIPGDEEEIKKFIEIQGKVDQFRKKQQKESQLDFMKKALADTKKDLLIMEPVISKLPK